MRNLLNRYDPHRLAGLALTAATGAFVIAALGLLLGFGAGSCPADLGSVAVRGLDGRTVCVVPSR